MCSNAHARVHVVLHVVHRVVHRDENEDLHKKRCSSRKVYKCFSRVLWATASSHDIDFVLKINSEKK